MQIIKLGYANVLVRLQLRDDRRTQRHLWGFPHFLSLNSFFSMWNFPMLAKLYSNEKNMSTVPYANEDMSMHSNEAKVSLGILRLQFNSTLLHQPANVLLQWRVIKRKENIHFHLLYGKFHLLLDNLGDCCWINSSITQTNSFLCCIIPLLWNAATKITFGNTFNWSL